MPESIPAPLIIDTLKDTFREARAALSADVAEPSIHTHLGWILSVPDTHHGTTTSRGSLKAVSHTPRRFERRAWLGFHPPSLSPRSTIRSVTKGKPTPRGFATPAYP